MTNENDVMICASWVDSPKSVHQLRIQISPLYNQRRQGDVDALIESTWSEKLEALTKRQTGGSGVSLFNGSKFRLHQLVSHKGGDDAAGSVSMHLGITDYKASIGCCENFSAIQSLVGPHELEGVLASAVGVEALLVTSDMKTVLFRRSQRVAEYRGWYCCPGGHPEPKNIFQCATSAQWSLSEQAQWFSHVHSAIIAAELHQSAVDEIHAELGIETSLLHNEGLIAVMRNGSNLKPDLIYVITTSLSGDDVAALHATGAAQEAFESEEGSLLLVPLTVEAIETTLKSKSITPPSQACLTLGLAWASNQPRFKNQGS